MRYFEGKPIELLAPAGNYEIFESIVRSKCDAVYFGGQQLNMRMIRKGFNFTDEELKKAVDLARSLDKKTYITVNNLLDYKELNLARTYLKTLEAIGPDALIVQDFAILELIKEMDLKLAIHASVMMNVHNQPMINALKRHGVERVVLSRETTLSEAAAFKQASNMELEYFTHGDMCIAHGAQCYHSSMIFGMSSNRGKCLKPCRWWYNDHQFPLAVKDLCMYPYLPEMIHAGITSFKIEGRMREKEFITRLIDLYGDALDRYIADPVGYDRYKDYDEIVEGRKRDLSTAYAFGNPGVSNINSRYEGTGKFYSTGKMFSTPTEDLAIDASQIVHVKEAFEAVKSPLNNLSEVKTKSIKTVLSVRVNNVQQAKAAIEQGVDRLYLAADVYLPDKAFTASDLNDLKLLAQETGLTKGGLQATELYMSTPRMMNSLHFEQFGAWLPLIKNNLDGLLVTNLGAIESFKDLGLPLVGDSSMNLFNPLAANFYASEGLNEMTASLELFAEDLAQLTSSLQRQERPLEVVAQGRPVTMYLEHDLYAAMEQPENQVLILENEAGRFPVYKDVFGRNHMLSTHSLCLLPALSSLKGRVGHLRIEAQACSTEEMKQWISLYQSALYDEMSEAELFETMALSSESNLYTFGALKF